ncbi:uncharacterized protein CLUP02_10033 [Colletotrichum lupini]|uniref:Uncharacterized protein n=1 Tax=Colletotrichum lupini TaxID=145971 RepID=A0A9Q8SXI8_9PEZI|nr:uncharacterized protein CLUP02_10033 [Colletotrichum lupini]UQC84536.1 hypothetical protein CLUP02_10033 [Colletotrichum lupini]
MTAVAHARSAAKEQTGLGDGGLEFKADWAVSDVEAIATGSDIDDKARKQATPMPRSDNGVVLRQSERLKSKTKTRLT